MDSEPKSIRQVFHKMLMSKTGLRRLTDRIVAIAMTQLVLELKVPELSKTASAAELLHRLGEAIPGFFSFWRHSFRQGAYCSFIAAVFFLTSMLRRLIF
jgi:uncharacterized membrane protein